MMHQSMSSKIESYSAETGKLIEHRLSRSSKRLVGELRTSSATDVSILQALGRYMDSESFVRLSLRRSQLSCPLPRHDPA